jgi:hypothetical protein
MALDLLIKVNSYFWEVQCLNCGNLVNKEVSAIKRAKRCRHCYLMPKGQSGLNRLFETYKGHAKNFHDNFC